MVNIFGRFSHRLYHCVFFGSVLSCRPRSMSGPEVSEYLLFCLASCLGPKQQAFGQKPTEVKMKLPNFVNPYADSSSKIGHDFNNNVVKKIKLPKNCFYKKCSSILQ